MKFVVTRTSQWDDATPPCPDAVLGEIDRWDRRTFKSPEEFDAKFGDDPRYGKWHDRGTDHQIERGPRGGALGIKRNMGPRPAWFVEFASLDDLVAFYHKHGDLVLTGAVSDESVPCVEIYDGYRE